MKRMSFTKNKHEKQIKRSNLIRYLRILLVIPHWRERNVFRVVVFDFQVLIVADFDSNLVRMDYFGHVLAAPRPGYDALPINGKNICLSKRQ